MVAQRQKEFTVECSSLDRLAAVCHLAAMRYLCLIMSAVFAQFTYWQFNDLQQYHTELWYAWVLAYAAICLISLLSWKKRLPRVLYCVLGGLALIATLVRLQSIEWSGAILYNPNNPAGNETGGLLVIALWMGALAWKRSRSNKT